MDLTTRCPQCGTIFSASLEQLQLRKGYIRCINCAHIFDGYDAVVSGAGVAAGRPAGAGVSAAGSAARPASAAPAASAASASPAAPAAPLAGSGSAAGAAIPPAAMPSVLRQRRAKEEPRFASAPAPARAEPARPAFSISGGDRDADRALREDPVFRIDAAAPATPDSAVGRRPEPVIALGRGAAAAAPASGSHGPVPQVYVEPRVSDADDGRPVPDFLDGEAPRYQGVVKLFWGVLIAAGLLLLLAQLAYVYRSQIANQIPALRPALTSACVSLNCQVAYSRHIDQISIMSSSLRASTGAGGATDAAADSMTLQLTMRNNYDKPQEWPTLVLDLTDFSGTLVVRKNLAPASYLPPAALQQPFAASSEITVGVPIVLNGLKVNGYQLGKFFP